MSNTDSISPTGNPEVFIHKKRGRPPGAKNKPKVVAEYDEVGLMKPNESAFKTERPKRHDRLELGPLSSNARIKILSSIAQDQSVDPNIRINSVKALDSMADASGVASTFLLELAMNKKSMKKYLEIMNIPQERIVDLFSTSDAEEKEKKMEELKSDKVEFINTKHYVTQKILEEVKMEKITEEQKQSVIEELAKNNKPEKPAETPNIDDKDIFGDIEGIVNGK